MKSLLILMLVGSGLGLIPSSIVDLRLHSGNDHRRPNGDDRAAVARIGGRVLHAFDVAVVRVALDTSGLRAVLGGDAPVADVAYPVADTTRLQLTDDLEIAQASPALLFDSPVAELKR